MPLENIGIMYNTSYVESDPLTPKPKPFILDYDSELKSSYVKPIQPKETK